MQPYIIHLPPTLDVESAAQLLKVHPETVKKLIASGAIPAAKNGRAWVMLSADVMAYQENQIRQQTAARLGGGRVTRALPQRLRRAA